jgi:nitrogen regulatory protein PII
MRGPVMRELYEAGVGGITCYMVHGMRSEKPTFLYSTRPFEVHHLPAALKLEVVCSEDRIDQVVRLLARTARGIVGAPASRPFSISP